MAILAPTTLLTQQHTENFRDRFADWPIKVDGISRFRSKKEQTEILKSLSEGKRAINRIRSFHKDIPIIVRCQEHSHYEELISLGANRVIPEVLESSLIITRQMLQLLDIREDEVDQQVADYLGSLKIKGLE